MKIYYEKDVKKDLLKNKKVGILGFGSQGHAHAQNLRDSGYNVLVGELKDSPAFKRAKDAGFNVMDAETLAGETDVIMMLVPDELQAEIYRTSIEKNLKDGKYLGFAHGFNIHYNQIKPPRGVNVFMVAPKGPGHLVRSEYAQGRGVPCLVAVHQDPSGDTLDLALSYASGIGAGRAGILLTTFKDETETDLFGEQVVLCGGLTSLIRAGFETLVEAGYPPELAYFECLHEVKLIVDLIYEGGIKNMRYSISSTAKYGDLTRGKRIINDLVKEEMKKILREIQSGEFAREWILENRAGRPVFNALTREWESHLIEEVGEKLRGMMPWLKEKKLVKEK